jgi:hypothetical protein
MPASKDVLGLIDRVHLPEAGALDRASFKEWYHFNLLDAASGMDVIANVSLAGDVTRAGAARADVIALCHLAGQGWFGTIDSYDAAAAAIDPARLHIALGPNRIAYGDGAYRLSIRLRDEPFLLEAQLQPRTEPMLIWNDTPIGSGRLNWLVVPHLEAAGRLTVGGASRIFDGICAYHDHNWGHWRWGDDFGWEWGFATGRPAGDAARATTVVFDRTSNRAGEAALEQTLVVWAGGAIAKLFTRRMIRARRIGRYAGTVPRVPGAASLIDSGQVLNIPAQYVISARDGSDWLDMAYRIDAGLQVSVPTDFGFGLIGLNETFGDCEITGEIGGVAIGFQARACFEFMS